MEILTVPCCRLHPDSASQFSEDPSLPLGEGASPADALEYFLRSIEKIHVFPRIPSDTETHAGDLWMTPKELSAAPSEDIMSFLGLHIEAATPISLERKKFRPPGSQESATQRKSHYAKMFGSSSTEPHSRVPTASHTKRLLSPLRNKMDSDKLPILCSDTTVRVDNSISTAIPSESSFKPTLIFPQKGSDKKMPVNFRQENDNNKKTPSEIPKTRPTCHAKRPSLFSRNPSNLHESTKLVMSASANGNMLIEI